jgi:hypothetical protein
MTDNFFISSFVAQAVFYFAMSLSMSLIASFS